MPSLITEWEISYKPSRKGGSSSSVGSVLDDQEWWDELSGLKAPMKLVQSMDSLPIDTKRKSSVPGTKNNPTGLISAEVSPIRGSVSSRNIAYALSVEKEEIESLEKLLETCNLSSHYSMLNNLGYSLALLRNLPEPDLLTIPLPASDLNMLLGALSLIRDFQPLPNVAELEVEAREICKRSLVLSSAITNQEPTVDVSAMIVESGEAISKKEEESELSSLRKAMNLLQDQVAELRISLASEKEKKDALQEELDALKAEKKSKSKSKTPRTRKTKTGTSGASSPGEPSDIVVEVSREEEASESVDVKSPREKEEVEQEMSAEVVQTEDEEPKSKKKKKKAEKKKGTVKRGHKKERADHTVVIGTRRNGSNINHVATAAKDTTNGSVEEDIRKWMGLVLEEELPEGKEFLDELRKGTILCQLVNKIEPNFIRRVQTSANLDDQKGRFACLDNLTNFSTSCLVLGVQRGDLFEPPVVLEHSDLSQLYITIHSLGKTLQSREGFSGPVLDIQESNIKKLSNKGA